MKKIPGIILLLFAIDLLLAIVYMANRFAGEPFYKLAILFDLNGEGNIPAWYSSIKLFMISAGSLFLLVKNGRKDHKHSWSLYLFPLLFLVMSIDEISQIHEWIGGKSDFLLPGGSRANTIFPHTGIWMFLIGIPAICLAIYLLSIFKATIKGRKVTFAKLFLGTTIFLLSATGTEILSNFVQSNAFWLTIQAVAEETGEMIGTTIILYGLYELLCFNRLRFEFNEPEERTSQRPNMAVPGD